MYKAHKKVANGIIVLGITNTSNMLRYTTNVGQTKHGGHTKMLYSGDLNNRLFRSFVILTSNDDLLYLNSRSLLGI